MRTLKKTLCLVLALALCFSLASVAFAGNFDDFTDADKVNYTEAVDVLIGIGVVEGDTATTINPQGDLTRAQAAKLITYLALGKTAAEAMKADSDPFTDVPKTNWAAGYIAYCANEGIINGNGDGTFRPTDKVTGYEFAKMILCVLGYGKNSEYTGKGWSIAVAKDALPLGLFTEVTDAASNAAIDRETAFQIEFNALTVQKVSYSKIYEEYLENGTTVAQVYGIGCNPDVTEAGIAGHQWKKLVTAGGVTTATGKAVSDFYADETASTVLTNGTTITAASTTSNTAYVAPLAASVTYIYNGAEVSNNSGSQADDLYVSNKKLMVYVDGVTDTEYSVVGAEVSIYLNTAGSIYKVSIIEKKVATVDTNGVTVTEVLNQPSNVTVDLATVSDITGTTKTVTGYEDLAKDDVILYYVDNSVTPAVTRIEKAPSSVGQLTAKKNVNGVDNYTISGKTYVVSGLSGYAAPASLTGNYNVDTTFYFDNFNNIVKAVPVTAVAAAKTYGVVLDYAYTAANALNGSSVASKVQFATTDGTVAVYDTATNNGAIANLTSNINSTVGLYEYVKNDSGVITKLDPVTAQTASTIDGAYAQGASKIHLDDGSDANDVDLYLSSSTIVVFYGGTFSGYDASAAATSVAVVTGYSNIPAIADNVVVEYVLNSTNPSVIDVLFVGAAAGTLTTAPNYAYIADAAPTSGVETINGLAADVYTYTAYIDGVETPLKSTVSTAVDAAGLYTYTTTNGYVRMTSAAGQAVASGTVTYVEGSYVVANSVTYDVSSTTKFYQVDATKKTVTEAELALVSGKTVTITYAVPNAAGTGYDAIYFTVS